MTAMTGDDCHIIVELLIVRNKYEHGTNFAWHTTPLYLPTEEELP